MAERKKIGSHAKSCPICRSRDVQVTSATPGDGRRLMQCRGCEHRWTNGKQGGYKAWPK